MPRREKREGSANRGRVAAIVAIVVLVGLAFSLRAIATFWTDYLWFDDLDLSSVWTSLLSAKVSLAVVATVVFFLIGWVNLTVADRLAPPMSALKFDDEVLDRYQSLVAGRQRLLMFVVALGVALVPGVGAASEWKTWLLFRFGGSFGVEDPQFGTDIGFFVFKLPFLSLVVDWLFGFLLVTVLLVAAVYYLNGSIRFQSRGERMTGSAKAHLSVLLAVMALVKAADYWLQRFELTLQQRESFDGAGYTAVNATLPALQLLILVSLFAAVLFVINIRRRGWVLPVIAIALWIITSVVLAGLYPAFVQRFQVSPAELNKEQPFIELNIEATRQALGIADIESSDFAYDPELTEEEVEGQRANLDLARLMDPAALGPQGGDKPGTIQSLQFGRPYYEFRDIDVDRYMISPGALSGDPEVGTEDSEGSEAEAGEGVATPVVISTRELDLDGIAEPQTWEKEHLVFTHGYGGALAPADEANSRGEPLFLLGDIPAVTAPSLPKLDRPEIYVGEGMEGYAIVDTKQIELTQDDLEASYDGSTGVGINSFMRKAAFALRFGEIDPLISDLLTGDSRVIYNRDAVQRVKEIAPYLLLDPDPYPVLMDGGISYVVDGYTTSSNYPYAEASPSSDLGRETPGETFNYVRNSVKAVVNAYDGTVTLYLSDTLYGDRDPIIRAYAKAFPDLYEEDLPGELRAHLRYPELLFNVQTVAWGRYHQSNPSTFFNNSDQWNIAQAPPTDGRSGQVSTTTDGAATEFARIEPYFQMLQLTPDREPEFLLTRPFVLASSNDRGRNLAAIMVASNHPDTYGKLEEVVIQAADEPGAEATTNRVDGTLQASELIATYQAVSEYQTLVGDNGSSVEFGNLLILPFGDSLLYLRPVYARQSSSGLNTLQRIAVTSGGSVGFGDTVEDAMADLLDGDDSGAVNQPSRNSDEPDTPDEEPEGGGSEEPTTTTPVGGSTEELLAEADRLFDDAEQALRDGDLGRYQDLVADARDRVTEALGGLSATPSGDGGSGDGGSGDGASGGSGSGETTTTTEVVGET